MIPRVKTWRVKFLVDCKLVNVIYVDTINKWFVKTDPRVVHAYWSIRGIYGDDADIRIVISNSISPVRREKKHDL